MTEHRERELKFDVADHWLLPELAPVVGPGGSVTAQSRHLVSTYYDTADHALLAHRVTLRRRTGEGEGGAVWTLKLPAGDARTEVNLPADASGEVPEQLRSLVVGLTAAAPLAPVATVVTHRTAHQVCAADGATLAELADDRVTATVPGESVTVTAWREVEVELVEGDEELLTAAAWTLTDAGARPSESGSKLARVLGQEDAPIGTATLFDLVRGYLVAQCEALAAGDVDLRRGRDVVHPTRVASRRFRSVLRVFGDLFDPARAAAMDEELRWYAEQLGALRDRQVLRAHLDDAVRSLPAEIRLGPVAARIDRTLDAEAAAARAVISEVMRSARYFALMREVRAWRTDAPFAPDNRPAEDVRRYVDAARRKVRKRLRRAPDADDPAAALHGARKAGKRARYAAELAEPALGRRAAKTVKRMKKLQNRLGDVQDSVVAAEFVRRVGAIAGTTPGENGFAFGVLWEREQQRRRAQQRRIP
jgi:CHAD domain-containing protein